MIYWQIHILPFEIQGQIVNIRTAIIFNFQGFNKTFHCGFDIIITNSRIWPHEKSRKI